MNWFIRSSRWLWTSFFGLLGFLNLLEDRPAGLKHRLSLTNVAFWSSMIFGLAVVAKTVLLPDSASVQEFAMVGVVSIIAALLKERRDCRKHGGDDHED